MSMSFTGTRENIRGRRTSSQRVSNANGYFHGRWKLSNKTALTGKGNQGENLRRNTQAQAVAAVKMPGGVCVVAWEHIVHYDWVSMSTTTSRSEQLLCRLELFLIIAFSINNHAALGTTLSSLMNERDEELT